MWTGLGPSSKQGSSRTRCGASVAAGVLVLSFCAPAEGRESGAGGQLQLLRLDDGALLPGRRDPAPLLWQTAFGHLEISPERLLLITELSEFEASRTISPRPFRLRLTDGELKVGWPLSVKPDGMRLELEQGGKAAVLLDDVLEVNDLPRSGPGGLAPLPRRGVGLAGTTGRTPQTGAASATPTTTPSERASTRRERRLAAARKALSRRSSNRRKRGVSGTGRLKQFGLGICGLWVGALAGGLIGAGAGSGGKDSFRTGLLFGASVGAAAAIYSTGESNGGEGSFWATLFGSALGVAVGVGLTEGNDSLLVLAPLLPLVGGLIGYVLTDETARK